MAWTFTKCVYKYKTNAFEAYIGITGKLEGVRQ